MNNRGSVLLGYHLDLIPAPSLWGATSHYDQTKRADIFTL